ncbi:STAS domain-containing protein [Candidatus Schmidhempelia bombi]|jgi:phospholipid transport system transporter-binding protein|uniref:STAS domain-containing protein n=1 Tax=Candidatus Schmidhempelia bombi str. Bimp TaxID=1387197 RepID=A0AB94IAU7_9GAMM|nr:STAS domain-containing protein [Candidatus Schmidhempelia bombi]TEA26528.1 STAS domain-containing protein [Candidatus Schmidhempelia bombi str. Bimp]
MSLIYWQQQDDVLYLKGVLDRSTLNQIWQQDSTLFDTIANIDVTELTRVDSAGLALLVNYCLNFNLQLIGINAQLRTLIQLYNLEKVIT